MTIATNVYNAAIQRGAERYMLRHIYSMADNFFNDEARSRVIFQFDADWSAITVCTKTWKIKTIKHFNSLVIASKFGKKFKHEPFSELETLRVSIKEYKNKTYAQDGRNIKYIALHGLSTSENNQMLAELWAKKFECIRFANQLLACGTASVVDARIDFLHVKYNEFIEAGNDMRKMVERVEHEH